MGINKHETPNSFSDSDLKKQGSKSLKLSKKNIVFLAFAIIILQVADTGLLWLVGGATSQYGDYGFHGDTFMYTAIVFIISRWIYSNYVFNNSKVSAQKALNADEVSKEAKLETQAATVVADTLKTRRQLVPRSAKTDVGSKTNWVPAWLKTSLPKRLNAKAKKFVPFGPSNVLHSEAPVFLPNAHVREEEKLLKSEYGGVDTGAVVYRSRHWLKEICPETKKAKDTCSSKVSKSPKQQKKKAHELVLPKDARKGSRSPEPAPKKKWQEKIDPRDIKWASAWSTFQTACSL